MAIHPYPTCLKRHIHMADGTGLDSRLARLEVADIERRFVRALSPRELAFIAVVTKAGQETKVDT